MTQDIQRLADSNKLFTEFESQREAFKTSKQFFPPEVQKNRQQKNEPTNMTRRFFIRNED